MRFCVYLIILFFAMPSKSFENKVNSIDFEETSWKVRVPKENEVLEIINAENRAQFFLPLQFRALLWNIQKAKHKEKWVSDFLKVARNRELILIQEAVLNQYMIPTINSFHYLGWTFATSFFNFDNIATGVSTASISKSVKEDFLRSPDVEPFLKTPKMTLLSIYMLADGQKLLVINTHGLNFVGNEKFYQQIENIISKLEGFQGPCLWAGDFNTWNSSRLNYMEERLLPLGFRKVDMNSNNKIFSLDQIFFRNINIKNLVIWKDIKSSDHYPITFDLSIMNENHIKIHRKNLGINIL